MLNIAITSRLHENGYRYKRESIQVNHENFKGVVTRVTNLANIAKQLQLTPHELEVGFIKFVKKSMGISTCGPLTFPGNRSASEFDAVLQKMIEKFILCPKCILPEWNGQHCAACGYNKEKTGKNSKKEPEEYHYDIITESVSPQESNTESWMVDLSSYMDILYETLKTTSIDSEKKKLNRQLDLCWKIETESSWNTFKIKNKLR
jgi:translation initiation factor 2 beta subunit (eIF-2beta)/eIF-5